ncbi:MAG: hypothetical protein JXR94_23690 [Candidatus Hydrogenedentes bacterium]|nr:hypothetical protein [Candidatus Hydrogenedentota bacterium]
MFFQEFSKCDYEERHMGGVFLLELLMRIMIRISPRGFVTPSKRKMTDLVEEILTLCEFPPQELALTDTKSLVQEFVDGEHKNIQAAANDFLSRFPDVKTAVQDLRSDLASLPENVPESIRRMILRGGLVSWLRNGQTRMRNKDRELRK